MNPPHRARVHVRRASVADLDDAVPLFDAYRTFYGAPSDPAAARAFLEARLTRDESAILLASVLPAPTARTEDTVGFAQLYPSFSSVSLAPIVILNDLFVAPSARGLGVAGHLVDAAIEHARRTGAISLELSTQHTNERALRLYRAKGFIADTEFLHLSLAITRDQKM